MMFFLYFYLWIFLFVIAENSTDDAKKREIFLLSFVRVKKLRKMRIKWCSRIHTSFQNICLFIFCFNFVVICVFGRGFFPSRTIWPEKWSAESVGFFPPPHLIIAKKWIGYFSCEFIRCWKKHSCIIIICSLAMVFCFVHFFFVLPFCCSFTFRFVPFLSYRAFFVARFVKPIELRWPFPSDKNILYRVYAVHRPCSGLCTLWMCATAFCCKF